MTQKIQHASPEWQSRFLLGIGLVSLASLDFGAASYSFQAASHSQVWTVLGIGVPTDAVIRAASSLSATSGVAFGAVIAGHLWRSGRKGLRRQAWLAIVVTAVAFWISVGNVSGYFAFTREMRAIEMLEQSPNYQRALANVTNTEPHYIPDADQRLVNSATPPATADRELGDVAKAVGSLAFLMGVGAAFRLPKKPARKRAKAARRPASGKPKLVHAREA